MKKKNWEKKTTTKKNNKKQKRRKSKGYLSIQLKNWFSGWELGNSELNFWNLLGFFTNSKYLTHLAATIERSISLTCSTGSCTYDSCCWFMETRWSCFLPCLLLRGVAWPLLDGVLGGAIFPLSSVGRCCLASSFGSWSFATPHDGLGVGLVVGLLECWAFGSCVGVIDG